MARRAWRREVRGLYAAAQARRALRHPTLGQRVPGRVLRGAPPDGRPATEVVAAGFAGVRLAVAPGAVAVARDEPLADLAVEHGQRQFGDERPAARPRHRAPKSCEEMVALRRRGTCARGRRDQGRLRGRAARGAARRGQAPGRAARRGPRHRARRAADDARLAQVGRLLAGLGRRPDGEAQRGGETFSHVQEARAPQARREAPPPPVHVPRRAPRRAKSRRRRFAPRRFTKAEARRAKGCHARVARLRRKSQTRGARARRRGEPLSEGGARPHADGVRGVARLYAARGRTEARPRQQPPARRGAAAAPVARRCRAPRVCALAREHPAAGRFDGDAKVPPRRRAVAPTHSTMQGPLFGARRLYQVEGYHDGRARAESPRAGARRLCVCEARIGGQVARHGGVAS
mmetsp:Transcript_27229/g.93595  ORF Transcript_27229/g.93595 Transcript_27229/m.93595 type:complete len:404 (-) Transcript_27229:4902-6113(-)